MNDPAGPRRAFLHAQASNLEPLAFVVVGLPDAPYDALQLRREEDESFVVEIAAREPATPFTAEQVQLLESLSFTAQPQTWAATPVSSVDAAVDLLERVLVDVLAVDHRTAIDVRHGTLRDERAAEVKLVAMRQFIEPVLAGLIGSPPATDPDGDYLLELSGMRIFVAPRAVPGRPPIIRVFAITNAGLNLTPDLGLFLARLNFSLAFGRFSIDTDHRSVWFDETLLGDQVTEDELAFVVRVVAETAAEWDDKIASMFGGTFRGTTADDPVTEADTSSKPGEGGYL